MLINPINSANFRQRRQIKNNPQTNFKGACSPGPFNSYNTIATVHAKSMPMPNTAFRLGKYFCTAEKGSIVAEELGQQISKLQLALKEQVEHIAETRPLSDENPNQYVHIITPQHQDPSIIYDVKGQIIDATYIYPQADDIFSFRFVKGELKNVVHCCATSAARFDSAPGNIIELSKENGVYAIANKTPVLLSKSIMDKPETRH